MQPSNYSFKTTPFAHQLKAFEISKDREYFALLLEQGLGKTKIIIDNASYLWNIGRINCLVVIAPNGVHENWSINEIPIHMPDYVQRQVVVWNAETTKKKEKELATLFDTGPHLRVLCINVEALSTKRGELFLKKVLSHTDSMLVVDESTTIKNPSALRSKAVLRQKNLAKYRRIATGTPITKSPFDAYAQFLFLSEEILGYTSFVAFKAHYAQLLDGNSPLIAKIMREGARFMPQIVATDEITGQPMYRNLPELHDKIAAHSLRMLKKDCLDLPPKMYTRRYYKMIPKQAEAYKSMRDKLKAEWNDSSTTATNKLVRMMRLQQIVSGYFPKDDEVGVLQPMFEDLEKNPKIAALLDAMEETESQVIIFCRFVQEIKDLAKVLSKVGTVAQYFGEVSTDDRNKAIADFQASNKRFFIMNKTGCRGITLTKGTTMVFYTNEFDLEIRLQAEDRPHRIGLESAVTYIDMECIGTIDSGIVANLRGKKNVANIITGDKNVDWL